VAPINIFSARPGTVVGVDTDAFPIGFAVDNSTTTFNDLKAIVTSVGIQGQAGFQFMHAMREFIYVYVFTERVGEIMINGIAFPGSCEALGPQDDVDGTCVRGGNGLERVLTWYDCNRITSRAQPITILFGADVAYDAFLVSMKADIANAENGVAQFSMRFNYIPNISDEDDFCFDIGDDCLELPCGSQGLELMSSGRFV
jgi:hypothetical protein